jgi:UDP-N-acetylmuramate--alanine ligase
LSLLLKNKEYLSCHFVGILGAGMSALAQYLHWGSVAVTGSDRLANNESTQRIRDIFESIGCRIFPQDGSGITPETGAVVVSTAIEDTNPDCIRARALGIPVFHRSDVLAACVNAKRALAIAGTSGKSTVAALLFHLLAACGRAPSLITGANLHALIDKGYIGNAFRGTSDLLVIEADESDGSLVKYRPSISVFLNLSKDHKPVAETHSLFTALARQSQQVFCNADDPALQAIPATASFGFSAHADFSPDTHTTDTLSATLTKGNIVYTIPFPGKHTLSNLLAALQVCSFLLCDPPELAAAVSTYAGIQRRFDRIPTTRGTLVIDDYAHNPEKISAVLHTVQQMTQHVFALFQPHGFGPTKFLLQEFIEMFKRELRESDTLYLLPIYYAGGTVTRDISSRDIAEGLAGCSAAIITPDIRDDVIHHIASHAQRDAVVISMGARDPTLPSFAQKIAHALD